MEPVFGPQNTSVGSIKDRGNLSECLAQWVEWFAEVTCAAGWINVYTIYVICALCCVMVCSDLVTWDGAFALNYENISSLLKCSLKTHVSKSSINII